MVVPFIGTQAWIRSLNFSTVDEWRPWFVDGQVAGWVHVLFIHQLTNNRPTNTVTLFRQAIYADLQGHTQTTSPLQPSRWEGAARSISPNPSYPFNEKVFFFACLVMWCVCHGLCRVVGILLRSTCQGNALLCLWGGFLVTPFDGVHSSSKFQWCVTLLQAKRIGWELRRRKNSCGRESWYIHATYS